MAWEPAERVQKNAAGEYRALIGGEWVPVSRAQKNAAGEFRVERGAASPVVKGDDYGDTSANPVMQFLGGAKHAWDKAAAALESAVPGGRALSQTLGQPDLPKLVEQGAKYVEETGPASSIGELGGELALTAVPGGVAYKGATLLPKIRQAGNLAKRVAGGTAAGATGSAMMGGDLEDVGTAGGISGAAEAVLPPAAKYLVKGIKGTGRIARDVLQGTESQASRYLQERFGDRADDIVAALRAAEPALAGETLTAGKAVGAQFPEMKLLQQRAENSPIGYKFNQIEDANLAARMNPLEEMAYPGNQYLDETTGRMISEAEALRKQASDPLYARAAGNRIEMTPEMQAIVEGAEAQRAVTRGERGFSQEQTNAMVGGRNVPTGEIPGVPNEGFNQFGTLEQKPFMPNYGSRSIEELQGIKTYLDSQISALAKSGADDDMMRRLSQARQQLNAQMEQQSGDYALANTTFRNFSAPQNQAEIAAVLRGQMEQGPAQFLKGMKDAPTTIKRADMSPRFGDLRQIMTPEQMDTLKALRSSAQREVDYAGTRVGEGMMPEARSVMERIEGALPPIFSQAITTLRKALSKGGKLQEEEIRMILNEAMLDPNKAADLISKVPKPQQGLVSRMLNDPRFVEAMRPMTDIGIGPMRGAAIGYAAGDAQD